MCMTRIGPQPDVQAAELIVNVMAQRLMELDIRGRRGAAYDEKNPAERLLNRRSLPSTN